jgi:indole-3-glycerol phosphate synthase
MNGYLEALAADLRRDPPEPARGFSDALAAGQSVALIAEIKRASPSQGAIAEDVDAAATAAAYTAGGAAALSVLCAERDFSGSLADLATARRASGLPAIAKDFTLFPEQVAAQRLAGADAILIILAMVGDGDAARLLQTAELLGMDALVEAHDEAEVGRALGLGARLVGVNARDLQSLRVDGERRLELLRLLPADVVRVAESGIESRADVEAARDAGADAVLVGTALMRRPELIGELTGVARR